MKLIDIFEGAEEHAQPLPGSVTKSAGGKFLATNKLNMQEEFDDQDEATAFANTGNTDLADEGVEWQLPMLTESNEFKTLQKHKKPLDDAERSLVMDRKAVWHHGPNGEPSPAVWKSVCPKTGKCTYVTNTHRAFNTATTLKGAIGRYHKFIKGTA